MFPLAPHFCPICFAFAERTFMYINNKGGPKRSTSLWFYYGGECPMFQKNCDEPIKLFPFEEKKNFGCIPQPIN
jgi:hypothetical protein